SQQHARLKSDICNLRSVDIETEVAYKSVISGSCAKPGRIPRRAFSCAGAPEAQVRTIVLVSRRKSLRCAEPRFPVPSLFGPCYFGRFSGFAHCLQVAASPRPHLQGFTGPTLEARSAAHAGQSVTSRQS